MNWRELLNETERCLYCGNGYDAPVNWAVLMGRTEGQALCEPCRRSLVYLSRKDVCRRCGREDAVVCSDCRRWEAEPFWQEHDFSNVSLYRYNPFLKDMIARLKYRGDACLAGIFTKEMQMLCQKSGPRAAVVPIPLTDERHYERGFNQAAVLAGHCGPMELLVREGESSKQSKRTRNERIAKTAGAIRVKQGEAAAGLHIILIDDIYTTGATVHSAARVLYEGGAESVRSVTLARA
ncbi:amidophosphoribosyltransferase [Alteribacter lacisalsi]|uniref:Amidophosphoribosyltransferase n=1 Tax=Alteribacter lacisalsi TaxID=2045244 RepID=A0A2W0H5G5_9BACI|nr:ComF family protein [Alteribacter lacisalsi]PYZ95856.1 amidophosphoribosyltransferase [Alteribacter lacisalsi]